jgi:hypothetical protein
LEDFSRVQLQRRRTLQDHRPMGYTVHVLAPHLVDGKVMGPYHHYCKVIAPDPQIVCLIYESTQPNAMLSQVEYIMAKKTDSRRIERDVQSLLRIPVVES